MQRVVRSVGIATAAHKEQAIESTRELIDKLLERGVQVRVRSDLADRFGPGAHAAADEELAATDLVISMGGDGTLIAMARHAAVAGTPLLGVDLGSFGFLAEERLEDIFSCLDDILAGRTFCEERAMVQAEVWRGGALVETLIGLNDAVIAKSLPWRLVRLHTSVDGELVAIYPADGLIISTPTGSTGYNLSAGGAIVDPRVQALLIAPICPHTLYSRPVIVDAKAVIEVYSQQHDHMPSPAISLVVDGQQAVELQPGDRVVLRTAAHVAKLIRTRKHSFYSRLRDKLRWGSEK